MTALKSTSSYMRFPRFARVTFALMMRDMSTTYGSSSFGYLWAILEPIGAIAMLSLAFSIALSSPALGGSFMLFYATGYIPFMMYNTMQNKVGAALRENLQLLFYPRVTYADAILSRYILTMLTQFLVAIIVFVGITKLDHVNQQVDLTAVFLSLSVGGFLGLGVGTLNCVIIHLMPSWRQLWSIITRPIFMLSCIFFLFSNLPEWVQAILWWNPIVHVVGEARIGFYANYRGEYVSLVYPMLFGAITLLIGLLLLRRHARDLINS
jgi:capsular polysaccharide transport system permease protein